jgi:hypothetical protein
MKRLSLFFLTLIVPMHLAWANVSCYSHTEVANTHFVTAHDDHENCGSHSHSHEFIEHEFVSANGDEHSAHCDACHAHLSTIIQEGFVWLYHDQPSFYTPQISYSLAFISADVPDRPQWL